MRKLLAFGITLVAVVGVAGTALAEAPWTPDMNSPAIPSQITSDRANATAASTTPYKVWQPNFPYEQPTPKPQNIAGQGTSNQGVGTTLN